MASAQHMSQRAHVETSLFTWKYYGSTQCSVLISLGHSVPRCLHQVRRMCCRTGGRSNCKASWLAPPSPMLLKRSVSTYPWYGQAPHFYSQISSKISSSSIASHTLFDADAEHAVLCFGTVFHRAAGNTAVALPLDAERSLDRHSGTIISHLNDTRKACRHVCFVKHRPADVIN
jgi:hypothetical protein